MMGSGGGAKRWFGEQRAGMRILFDRRESQGIRGDIAVTGNGRNAMQSCPATESNKLDGRQPAFGPARDDSSGPAGRHSARGQIP